MNRTKSLLLLTALLMHWPSQLWSHENVVVIPVIGDDRYTVGEAPSPVTPESRPNSDFASVNGVVIDQVTNLAWQGIDDGVLRTWSEATEYCRGVRLLNRSDWRLPTVQELYTIVDFTNSPTTNTDYFNFSSEATSTADPLGGFWTSVRSQSPSPLQYSWVSFNSGTSSTGVDQSDQPRFVRCVI